MNKFSWLKIFVAAGVLALFFGGIYYYAHYHLAGTRGFSETSKKLQESGALVFDMAKDLQLRIPESFAGLAERESARDFKSAVKIVDGSLAIVDQLRQKNETLQLKTQEFKSAADSLRKKEAVSSVLAAADVLRRLVLHFEKIVGLERELLTKAKNYYEALIVNEKAEAPSFIEVNAKIAIASGELSTLLSEFAAAANDLNMIIAGKPAVTAKSELKIEDVALGQSQEAKNGNTLIVHYEGYLIDGTKFDSSVDRGQPFSFVLGSGRVIQGWEQGLLGMKIGGHRRLTIPPELGYGARGQGAIPPNSTLIFEIDLLDIK